MQALDVFMAGDDVPEKKPDPSIYVIAAERLGVYPSECLVIEDSTIGLRVSPMQLTYAGSIVSGQSAIGQDHIPRKARLVSCRYTSAMQAVISQHN